MKKYVFVVDGKVASVATVYIDGAIVSSSIKDATKYEVRADVDVTEGMSVTIDETGSPVFA